MNPSCLLRAQELTCQMPTFDSGGKRMTYKHKTAAAAVRAFSPYHSHLAPIVITKEGCQIMLYHSTFTTHP